MLLVGVAEAVNADPLLKQAQWLLREVLDGALGINSVLNARTESLQVGATFSNGEWMVVWQALPSLEEWMAATALWGSAALIALGAAAAGHRECRSCA